jgi:hypothetical protein
MPGNNTLSFTFHWVTTKRFTKLWTDAFGLLILGLLALFLTPNRMPLRPAQNDFHIPLLR